VVADTNDDTLLPDEDENAAPSDIEKKTAPQHDDQLDKAIEVLKARQG
jgi:hypothetical protein